MIHTFAGWDYGLRTTYRGWSWTVCPLAKGIFHVKTSIGSICAFVA